MSLLQTFLLLLLLLPLLLLLLILLLLLLLLLLFLLLLLLLWLLLLSLLLSLLLLLLMLLRMLLRTLVMVTVFLRPFDHAPSPDDGFGCFGHHRVRDYPGVHPYSRLPAGSRCFHRVPLHPRQWAACPFVCLSVPRLVSKLYNITAFVSRRLFAARRDISQNCVSSLSKILMLSSVAMTALGDG